MSGLHCHGCGAPLPEGAPKYKIDVRVRSVFDGTIPEADEDASKDGLDRILAELSGYNEEEASREVYEDDVFIMCPECKDTFLDEIYSHIHPQATPEAGRAHLIN